MLFAYIAQSHVIWVTGAMVTVSCDVTISASKHDLVWPAELTLAEYRWPSLSGATVAPGPYAFYAAFYVFWLS